MCVDGSVVASVDGTRREEYDDRRGPRPIL
jgi:hypothetical protein